MIDQRKRIFAVNRWVVDLVLTTASFFLAYWIRSLIAVEDHTLMSIHVYLWLLAIILPTWAVLLPLFSVYSEPTLAPLSQIARLSKAILGAWIVLGLLVLFLSPNRSNRIILVFALAINYIFLVSYRLVLMKVTKHGALDDRHVAVIGRGASAYEFGRAIESYGFWGLKLVGVFGREDVRSLLH